MTQQVAVIGARLLIRGRERGAKYFDISRSHVFAGAVVLEVLGGYLIRANLLEPLLYTPAPSPYHVPNLAALSILT